jgi:hypothetical protein
MEASGVNQWTPSPVRDTPIHIKGTMTKPGPPRARWLVRHLIAISGRRNVPKIGERTCQRS